MRTPDSKTLLELMQQGDLRALDVMTRAYSNRLLALARAHCRRSADAEDAVQQSLLAASSAMTGFRAEGSALAWLSTLVVRTCARLNKHDDRQTSLESEPCSCDDPALAAERRELARTLSDALMNLPRTDRLVVLLSAEGLTGPEIADELGLSHDAVRGRLKRARHTLRAAVADTPSPVANTSGHDHHALEDR